MDRLLDAAGWLEIFGSLKWNNGSGFELVYAYDKHTHFGRVWLQTENAEEDCEGTSCLLPHVKLWSEAVELKKLLDWRT